MAEIKATPRREGLGLIADALNGVSDFLGTSTNPVEDTGVDFSIPGLVASAIKPVGQVADMVSYGEDLTTGKGFTTQLKDPVVEAAIELSGFAGVPVNVAKAAIKYGPGAGKVLAKELGPKAGELVEGYITAMGGKKNIVEQSSKAGLSREEVLEEAYQAGLRAGLPEGHTRMDRARLMGFDTEAFHGTEADIREFNEKLAGSNTGESNNFGALVFTTNDPRNASQYSINYAALIKDPEYASELMRLNAAQDELRLKLANSIGVEPDDVVQENKRILTENLKNSMTEHDRLVDQMYKYEVPSENSNVLPLLIRSDDLYPYDAAGAHYSKANPEAIRNMEYWGFPAALIKNVKDNGGLAYQGLSDSFVFKDPSRIRSRFAAFNPEKSDSRNLLAGSGAASTALVPEEEE